MARAPSQSAVTAHRKIATCLASHPLLSRALRCARLRHALFLKDMRYERGGIGHAYFYLRPLRCLFKKPHFSPQISKKILISQKKSQNLLAEHAASGGDYSGETRNVLIVSVLLPISLQVLC